MAKFVFETSPVSSLEKAYDLVVIGAGGTGLTAALQAHELGLTVAVLEKMLPLAATPARLHPG